MQEYSSARFEPATLPRTKAWRHVLHLLAVDGTIAQITAATIDAANAAFKIAGKDPVLRRAVALLEALVPTSSVEELGAQLRQHISVLRDPITALEFVGAMPALMGYGEERGDSALAELAPLALMEVLAKTFHEKGTSVFEANATQSWECINATVDPEQKHLLVAAFWESFLYRCLQYFLSRETSNYVGENRRFKNIEDLEKWGQELRCHCGTITETFRKRYFSHLPD